MCFPYFSDGTGDLMVRYHLGPGSTGRAAAGQAIAAAPAWCWAACVALLAAGQAQTWSWKVTWNSKKWGLKLLKMISGWIVGEFVGKKIWNDVGFEYPRDLISIFFAIGIWWFLGSMLKFGCIGLVIFLLWNKAFWALIFWFLAFHLLRKSCRANIK